MEREIVKINEDLCNGCGECVPACHEGALQIIDGKARLVSDLMCDGLGACLGHCPQDAISIERREAEPYDETKVMKLMCEKGKNTVIAHLKHLKDHDEIDFFKEAIEYIRKNEQDLDFVLNEIIEGLKPSEEGGHHHGGGCPGSKSMSFDKSPGQEHATMHSGASQLRQWPVQMHLIHPGAAYFKNSDLLLAADCVAFSLGDFHATWLKDKTLAIACPKLDDGADIYIEKLRALIDEAKVNTITVMMMQVPCCGGLAQMVSRALSMAGRKVPVKQVIVGVEGDILSNEWM